MCMILDNSDIVPMTPDPPCVGPLRWVPVSEFGAWRRDRVSKKVIPLTVGEWQKRIIPLTINGNVESSERKSHE